MWCLKSLKLASIIIILSGETYYWGHRHAVIWRFFYSFKKDKLTSGGYSLWWPIREGSVRKGYGFFRPQIHERVGISLIEAYKRVVKSVIWVCERAQKGKQCSVLQKCLSSQLPMQSNWCLTPSADRGRVSKGGLRACCIGKLKKKKAYRCNLMRFEAYSNRKIKVNLRLPVFSFFYGKVHNSRES